jgi:hypothetical protein
LEDERKRILNEKALVNGGEDAAWSSVVVCTPRGIDVGKLGFP